MESCPGLRDTWLAGTLYTSPDPFQRLHMSVIRDCPLMAAEETAGNLRILGRNSTRDRLLALPANTNLNR